MFCVKCGNELQENTSFCSKCGNATIKTGVSVSQSNEREAQVRDSEYVNSLLEYLQNILHCEATLIGLESSLQQNREVAARLCLPRNLPSPPEKPALQKEIKHGKGAVAGLGLFGVLSLTLFAPIAIPLAIKSAVDVVKVKKGRQKRHEEHLQEHDLKVYEYEDEIMRYNARVAEENARMVREDEEKQLLELQSSEVDELISHTEETLSTLYGTKMLHGKYQNFVAVASMHDYLSAGRTASLVRNGDDPGAYNIYEEDVRIGKVVSVIGMVGNQIIGAINEMADAVRYQQQALYDAVCAGNELQQALASDMSERLNGIKERQEKSVILQKEILKQEKLRTDAMRVRIGFSSIPVLRDKSGYKID